MTTEPTFDEEGYPTELILDTIRDWPMELPSLWLVLCRNTWDHHYGTIREKGEYLELVTGGWSGNESVISAMHAHPFWHMLWESSHRGGLYVLKMPATTTNP